MPPLIFFLLLKTGQAVSRRPSGPAIAIHIRQERHKETPALLGCLQALLFVQDQNRMMFPGINLDRQIFLTVIHNLVKAVALVTHRFPQELAKTAFTEGKLGDADIAVDFDTHPMWPPQPIISDVAYP